MASGEDGHKRAFHHCFLTENDPADALSHFCDVGQRAFRRGDHLLVAQGLLARHLVFGNNAHAVSILVEAPQGGPDVARERWGSVPGPVTDHAARA